MLPNNSVFQRKKVIFNLGQGNNIITQFNLNTTILYIKIYIRDRLNLNSNFDLFYKSTPIKSNSTPLYKFFKGLNEKTIRFTLKKRKSPNKSLNNIKKYEKEYRTIKETNKKLVNNIKIYKNNINKEIIKENKNNQRYKSLENLLIRQNDEINQLKKEIDEANNRYIKLKLNKMKYIKSNSSFSIISKEQKIPKCFSVESFNTMYLNNSKNCNTYYNTQNNTNSNININTIKEKSTFDLIKDLSSIETNSKMNYNDTNNNIYINENSVANSESNQNTLRLNKDNYNELFKENDKISRNEKAKNKSIIYSSNKEESKNEVNYQYKMKEYNLNDLRQVYEVKNKANNVGIVISQPPKEEKEEDKINFNEILEKFELNNDVNEKSNQVMNNIKDKNGINKCFISIFKYLNINEIYTFSLINKPTGICSLYFLINSLLNKINYLNSNYNSLKTRYEELFTNFFQTEFKSSKILSHNSKSGLRILNSPHYLNIYNNPIEYFTKNKSVVFIYRILYQLTTDKIIIEDDNMFISLIIEEIKTKTATKKSLRDYIYFLLDKNLDFNFDNIVQCKKVIKKYGMENIEINKVKNMDRTNTIINYVVKDLMEFTGLIKCCDQKKKGFGVFVKKVKNEEEEINYNGLKYKILIVCESIEEEIHKNENNIKNIEEIINKYYL